MANQKLTKELEYINHKYSLLESNKGLEKFEKLFFERMIEFLEKADDQVNCCEIFEKIGKSYSAFGTEKVKILDSCMNMFLENVFAGSNIKQDLWILDKKYPQTAAEKDKFLKMKKFQQYETYPDEHVRDRIFQRSKIFSNKEEFLNDLKNAMPVYTTVKSLMKEGISTLLKGKDQIYSALMKYDTAHNMSEGRI